MIELQETSTMRVERDVRLVVRINVTREEREDIHRWAEEAGLSMEGFIRQVIGLSSPERRYLEYDL